MKIDRRKLFLIILMIAVLAGYLVNGFVTKNLAIVANKLDTDKSLDKLDKLIRNHRMSMILNMVILVIMIIYSFTARIFSIDMEKQNRFLSTLGNIGLITSLIWLIQLLRLMIKIG